MEEALFTPSIRTNRVDYKKTRLINLARDGYTGICSKGQGIYSKNIDTRQLFYCYAKYVQEGHPCYDPVFVKAIENISPEWIDPLPFKTVKRKEDILELAEENKHSYTRDGVIPSGFSSSISQYTDTISIHYDEGFTHELARINHHWLNSELKDEYVVKDLENFFLENYRFPRHIKAAYKDNPETHREGYLFYWLREYSRAKQNSRHATRSRDRTRKVHAYIRKSALPNDLLQMKLCFFNRSMRYLKELEEFYRENQRYPQIHQGRDKLDGSTTTDESERRLCLWLRARRSDRGNAAQWARVAQPLLKKAGLPKATFSP